MSIMRQLPVKNELRAEQSATGPGRMKPRATQGIRAPLAVSGQTWARDSTAATTSAMASGMGTPFFCEPSR